MLILFKISLDPFDSIFLICHIFEFFFNVKKHLKFMYFVIETLENLSNVVFSLIPVLFCWLLYSSLLPCFVFFLFLPTFFFFFCFVIVDCELIFSSS